MKHRIVIEAERGGVAEQGAAINAHLEKLGYAAPDLRIVEAIAAHEWRADVLEGRKARLGASGVIHRIAVRALGFDLYHSGELSVGLSKTTFAGGTATMTAKASLLLLPGDPLELIFDTLALAAHRSGYEPICAEDIALTESVATYLWTQAAITARDAEWDTWQVETGVDIAIGKALELGHRLVHTEFRPLPVGGGQEVYFRKGVN